MLYKILGWFISIYLLNRYSHKLPEKIEKGIHWLHAMSFESLAVLLSLFGRGYGPFFVSKRGGGDKTPLLLIHGYLHNSSAWVYQKNRLSKAGLGPIYTLNLGSPFQSIEDFAKIVEKKAKIIEEETKKKELILIGHSMGGLVASYYALSLAPKGKVTDLITIGTPLKGTYLASLARGPNARQMEKNSPFVQKLSQEINQEQEVKFYHIGALTDQIIVPNTSAFLENPKSKSLVIKDLGHMSLLYAGQVAKQIEEWLES